MKGTTEPQDLHILRAAPVRRLATTTLNQRAKRTSLQSVSVFCFLLATTATAEAADNGLFIQGDLNISMGPGQISLPGNKLAGVTERAAFGLSNDGRFAYGGALGYVYNAVGVRFRYQSLGRQRMMSFNGAPVGDGGLNSRYMGIDAMYFLPLAPGKVDLVFTSGLGRLNSTLTFNRPVDGTTVDGKVSQDETVLSLGIGMRVALTKQLSLMGEVSRLTPIQSGGQGRGIYNNGHTIISAGLMYRF